MSTRFSSAPALPCVLQARDTVLVAKIEQISEHHSYGLYDMIQRSTKNRCASRFIYYSELDMEAKMLGIPTYGYQNAESNLEQLTKLYEKLGVRYLLTIKVLRQQRGESYAFYTREELYMNSASTFPDNLDRVAQVAFQLYDLANQELISSFIAETTINSWASQNRNGDEHRYNFGSIEFALSTAIGKGIKRIYKNCGCNWRAYP
ncbi:MAG: hypothetical protein HC880_07945 [Bacteroidia bacterium]|nr:hypothetical protein [Bacteroidia bacterium]